VAIDAFTVLAEPTRRRILDELRLAECSVGDLVAAIGTTQPTVSKHLKVLRDAGFVTREVAAQQRIYRIAPRAFAEVGGWLEPYRGLWATSLDALERHLDDKERQP
jgi:DNA-binding transcriptional ArsR family regulator